MNPADFSGVTSDRAAHRDAPVRHSCGFTLLELVVVTAIITALAGILVLVLPDMMKKTNDARAAANLTELDKILQTYHAANGGKYPNDFDSLVTTGTSSLFSYLPTDGTNYVGGYLTTGTLTALQVSKLSAAGITEVYDMSASTSLKWATFMPQSGTRTLAEGGAAAFLAKSSSSYQTLAGTVLKLEDDHDYVVFGVGRRCTLIGVGGMVKDVPAVIHNNGCQDPKATYCAVCAIFDLGSSSDNYRGVFAKFVGCVALAADGFITSEMITNQVEG